MKLKNPPHNLTYQSTLKCVQHEREVLRLTRQWKAKLEKEVAIAQKRGENNATNFLTMHNDLPEDEDEDIINFLRKNEKKFLERIYELEKSKNELEFEVARLSSQNEQLLNKVNEATAILTHTTSS